MRAEDVMSTPAVTVREDAPAKSAIALLTSHGFTALPVLDADDRLVGVVTEADLMRDRVLPDARGLIWRDEEPAAPAPARLVRDAMTGPAVAVRAAADIAEVAKVLLDKHIRCVPVADGTTLLGIVSRRDLLRTLARDDDAIVTDVRHRLAAYGGHGRWAVSVLDGAVTVVDEFDDADDRHVATVLAASAPGVQSVDVTARVDRHT
ncbi:CBS domain-containing protein [Umezawaea sp. Da 62-37]|uniref:CBS domain-containing protein n=1 Tax=Umezawaea sp. Da 62-37 TaxID=3075927 RepID=UPI0028F70032|nr:CBS domain-containing protein [Umezawaea sp. Da 62-37]WNV88653.1 CBS domain-containing protein [Umezawaea sp. Da 62-37]